MSEQTPIPAEALAAAIEEAWRIAVCYGELVPDEAKRHLSVSGLTPHMALNKAQVGTVVTRIAPILLAAGRTDALRSVAEMFDALPPCPTYLDCTAGGEPHDRHETAGATLLRLADEMEATGRG